jgi:carbon storage regulator
MLVLSRRASEVIMIGESITVVVVAVHRGRVVLGFNAPSDVAIHRREVRQRMRPGGCQGEAPTHDQVSE